MMICRFNRRATAAKLAPSIQRPSLRRSWAAPQPPWLEWPPRRAPSCPRRGCGGPPPARGAGR
eukprot:15209412-Alexandrium_andersonii.AAC.1